MEPLPDRWTENQMQNMSEAAEKTVRDYILSQVFQQRISDLEIVVEAIGSKRVTVAIAIDLALSPVIKKCNAAKLVDEAAENAFVAIEECIEELDCKFRT